MEESTDTKDSQTEEKQELVVTDEFIRRYQSDERVINFIQKKFKRLSVQSSINLLRLILMNQLKIHYSVFTKKSFINHNKAKFDENGNLREDEILNMKKDLEIYLKDLGKELITYEGDDKTILEKIDEECYKIDKHSTYEQVRKLTCNEIGKPKFRYNFNSLDLNVSNPKNKMSLQRVNIQILSRGIKFDYPLEYVYNCSK